MQKHTHFRQARAKTSKDAKRKKKANPFLQLITFPPSPSKKEQEEKEILRNCPLPPSPKEKKIQESSRGIVKKEKSITTWPDPRKT
jgi:hypothetical protein